MALLEKKGYGQVEPNHLSAQKTGQIFAQLPCDDAMDIVENGMFLFYDMAAGKIATSGNGEAMLVYSEIKLYDQFHQIGYKDFAIKKAECVGGKMYPRLFKTNIGDFYTTNLVDITAVAGSRVGVKLVPVNGILTEKDTPDAGDQVWVVVKETGLADYQKALKVQRIA